MRKSRRDFCVSGVASLCTAVALGQQVAGGEQPKAPQASGAGKKRCLDYGLSFICNSAPGNSVRFWVESRTTIIDDRTGTSTDYYQCGACKSENTFDDRDLFKKDNYDFTPILGGEYYLLLRRPAGLSASYRQIVKTAKVWGPPILKLREAPTMTLLDTWEKIRDATAAAIPIVTQTEIANPETGLRAILECPTKTMNMNLERKVYQVDTGPIALPDLTKRFAREIECLSLAFIAFNAPHFADFVIEQPTPVIENGKEVCRVFHYSGPISLPARNLVWALGKL